ncbi:MAG: ABC transporter permease [Bacteroidetes bacterium]|nr:ABC transporter permease [Bacteroidota bacterium]
MFELFISKRYLHSKHKINFISIISIISTIGITIGVAALIIVMSVFNGFGSLVKSILINFDPHVTIHSVNSLDENQRSDITEWLKNNNNTETFYAFAEGKVVLQNGRNYQVVTLKGITEQDSSRKWGIKSSLLQGDINLDSKNINEASKILLSQRMAMRLSCSVGDSITVSSFDNLQRLAIDFTAIPQTRIFEVAGVFSTDNPDYDIQYVYCPLFAAQNILEMNTNISGYEIRLFDIDDSDNLKEEITANFKTSNIDVSTWYDLHKDLYNVMLIERWSAFLLLSLIISVATFNILGSLTMSVIEKRRDIGILRSMGVKVNSIIKIFMFEGILIGVIGTALGLVIGVFVCYLQIEFKFYALDPGKYIIDAMPVDLQLADILSVAFASLFLTFIASLYPAKRAAKVNLIDSIKYE